MPNIKKNNKKNENRLYLFTDMLNKIVKVNTIFVFLGKVNTIYSHQYGKYI